MPDNPFAKYAPQETPENPFGKLKPEPTGKMESIVRGVSQGFLGNFRDELQGIAAASPTSIGRPEGTPNPYDAISVLLGAGRLGLETIAPNTFGDIGKAARERVLAEERFKDQAASVDNPITYGVANVGGMIANPIVRTAPMNGAMQGALSAGTIGAVQGAGDGTDPGSRLAGATTNGFLGALIGGPLGYLFGRAKPPTGGPPGAGSSIPDVISAGDRTGVSVPQFVATESPTKQALAQGIAQIPFAGGKIEGAASAFKQGVADAAERAAQSVGSGEAIKSGETAKRGLSSAIENLQTRSGQMYDAVDALITNPKATTTLSNTQSIIADIAARRQAAGLDGGGSAVEHVLEAATRPNGLTYQGVKDLRTSVGEMLKPGKLPQGMSQGELKQIYGSLTQDLEAAISGAGGKPALQAWQKANQFHNAARSRQEKFAQIIGVNGDETGERIFSRLSTMASSGANADIRTLNQARKALRPDEWNELASGVISKLGVGGRGEGAEFSGEVFLTNWNKLSKEGKTLLFGPSGGLRQSLDDIALLAGKMKQAERFANRSNTGRATQVWDTAKSFGAGAGSVMAGSAVGVGAIPAALTALAGLVGANGVAKMLARPATAKAFANWSKTLNAAKQSGQMGRNVMVKASSQLGAAISKEFGVPANDVTRALSGYVKSAAEEEN